MFMVKCKYFADANITNILNIRKFLRFFLKKIHHLPLIH